MDRDFSGYFASGSNRVGEIRGIAAAGRALGVAADQVSPAAEAELHQLAGRGIPVFVDSGAFGEVSFEGGWHVVRPIQADDWERILGLYERLARSLGSALYVVAPDMVGQQGATLDRLDRYSDRVRQLRGLGANVIVPSQRGDLSAAQFDRQVEQVLGFGDYVLPYLKGRAAADYAAALAGCDVTSDSVRILAICGRGRPLFEAKQAVRRDLGLPDGNMPTEAYAEAVWRCFRAEGGNPPPPDHAQCALSDAEFFARLEVECA